MVPRRKGSAEAGKRLFKRVDGRDFPKGARVEVIEETGRELTVRNIDTKFEYFVNKVDFIKQYVEV